MNSSSSLAKVFIENHSTLDGVRSTAAQGFSHAHSMHMDTAELCGQLAADSHRECLVEVFECRSRPAAEWAPFSSAPTVVAHHLLGGLSVGHEATGRVPVERRTAEIERVEVARNTKRELRPVARMHCAELQLGRNL